MGKHLWFLLVGLSCSTVQASEVQIEYQGLVLNGRLNTAVSQFADQQSWLIVHGTLAHAEMEMIDNLMTLLAEQDLPALAINLSYGVSDRTGMMPCEAPQHHLHEDALPEIDAWVQWLRRSGATEIVLAGHSRGGNQIAQYATKYSQSYISGLVMIAPMVWNEDDVMINYAKKSKTPLPDILQVASQTKHSPASIEWIEQIPFLHCQQANVSKSTFLSYYGESSRLHTPAVLKGSKIPGLVFLGDEDKLVPAKEWAEDFSVSSEVVSVEILSGADHFFRDLYGDDIVELSIEWLAQKKQ